VKYVFGAAPPVARLKPGNILDANSLDCFGNALQKPGDSFSLVKGDNPLTGPFYIEGAEPGDTLVVHLLDVQVDGKQGVGTFSPGFGAINATHYTPMLEKEALPEKIWFYPIDHAERTATFQALDSSYKVKIPLHRFLGCIGVAPANGEARSSIVPAEFGGNMDAPEASAGNTLHLPVNVAGALFYFGDGHAAMGDGEIAGSAIEVPMKVRLQFDPSTTPCASPSPSWWAGFTRTMASRNSMPTSFFRKSAKSISPRWSTRTTSWLLPLRRNICHQRSRSFYPRIFPVPILCFAASGSLRSGGRKLCRVAVVALPLGYFRNVQ